jgi:Glycosyl transferase family 90
MVALATYPENAPSPSLHIKSPALFQSRLDIRFTGIVGCDEPTCEVMKALLPPSPPQTLTETFHAKIALDMDGHGLSGRFYMLLQSNSAVMKQGLVREWHDARLLPWLHYIPLSMDMAELEDMLEFFFGTGPRGDRVLEAIADEGRTWVRRALRRDDMRVYMYRLLLELARRTF